MTKLVGPIYRPGQTVPASGQYGVCDVRGSYLGHEATCTRGEPFPPVRPALHEYGWRLRDLTQHGRL
jgi:hypothetical protein